MRQAGFADWGMDHSDPLDMGMDVGMDVADVDVANIDVTSLMTGGMDGMDRMDGMDGVVDGVGVGSVGGVDGMTVHSTQNASAAVYADGSIKVWDKHIGDTADHQGTLGVEGRGVALGVVEHDTGACESFAALQVRITEPGTEPGMAQDCDVGPTSTGSGRGSTDPGVAELRKSAWDLPGSTTAVVDATHTTTTATAASSLEDTSANPLAITPSSVPMTTTTDADANAEAPTPNKEEIFAMELGKMRAELNATKDKTAARKAKKTRRKTVEAQTANAASNSAVIAAPKSREEAMKVAMGLDIMIESGHVPPPVVDIPVVLSSRPPSTHTDEACVPDMSCSSPPSAHTDKPHGGHQLPVHFGSVAQAEGETLTPEVKAAEPAAEATADELAAEAKADEPAAEAKVDAPAAEAKADEPVAEAKADEPATEAKADEPTAEAKADLPVAEAKAGEPAAEAKVDAPAAEAKANEPVAEAKADEPAAEAKVDAPAAEAKADLPVAGAKPDKPAVEAKADDQVAATATVAAQVPGTITNEVAADEIKQKRQFQSDEWRSVNKLVADLDTAYADDDDFFTSDSDCDDHGNVATIDAASSLLTSKVLGSVAAPLPTGSDLGYSTTRDPVEYKLADSNNMLDAAKRTIPADLPTRVVTLIRDGNSGFGFQLKAPHFGSKGIRVAAILAGGAADRAGVKFGEVLVAVDHTIILWSRSLADVTSCMGKDMPAIDLVFASPANLGVWMVRHPGSMPVGRLPTGKMKLHQVGGGSRDDSDAEADLASPAVSAVPAVSALTAADEAPQTAPKTAPAADADGYYRKRVDKIYTIRDRFARRLHDIDDASEALSLKTRLMQMDVVLDKLATYRLVKDISVNRKAAPDGKALGFQVRALASGTGGCIVGVAAGGAAELGGLKVNDIVMEIDGYDVVMQKVHKLVDLMKTGGDVVTLRICRDKHSDVVPETPVVQNQAYAAPPMSRRRLFDASPSCPPDKSSLPILPSSTTSNPLPSAANDDVDYEETASAALSLAANFAEKKFQSAWNMFNRAVKAVSEEIDSVAEPPGTSKRGTALKKSPNSLSYYHGIEVSPTPACQRLKFVTKSIVERKPSDKGLGVVLKSDTSLTDDDEGQFVEIEIVRVHFITDGSAFSRTCAGMEGSVMLAVNGDFVYDLPLPQVINLVKNAGDLFVVTLCPFEGIASATKDQLFHAVGEASCKNSKMESATRAAEARIRSKGRWSQLQGGSEAAQWETPVKVVSKDDFVAPIAMSKQSKGRISATLAGDQRCTGCNVNAKSIVFGCGHCTCEDCSEKCHACPVKGCGRIIMTRCKLSNRFRSKLHEKVMRPSGGTGLHDMDTGDALGTPDANNQRTTLVGGGGIQMTTIHTDSNTERGILAGSWSMASRSNQIIPAVTASRFEACSAASCLTLARTVHSTQYTVHRAATD